MQGTASVSRAIEVTAIINSSVEEIFNYLTSAPLLARWLCRKAESNPVKGGDYALWLETESEDKPDIYGQFINFVENKTVQYVWIDTAQRFNSLVTAVLNQKPDGIRIDLYHTSLPIEESYDELYYSYAKFWKNAFDRLIEHLSD